MCGIVAYLGEDRALPILLGGLKRLEYRGYDSSGVALVENGKIIICKRRGKIKKLKEKVRATKKVHGSSATTGIAHTRWATHGLPTDQNAHPHFSCRKHVAVVHNGIITNFREIRAMLKKRGHKLIGDSDSVVLAHLIGEYLNGDPLEAVRSALSEIEGTYGIAVVFSDYPDVIVFAKKGSPLRLGIGEHEYLISSDASPFVDIKSIKRQIVLKNDQIGIVQRVRRNGTIRYKHRIYNDQLVPISAKAEAIEVQLENVSKGRYPHYMLKEICEQPDSLANTMGGRLLPKGRIRLGGLENHHGLLRRIQNFNFISAGTSLYAAAIGEILMQEIGLRPSQIRNASELGNQLHPIFPPKTALWAISQSGETADLLLAMEKGRQCGLPVLGLCNVVGSAVARASSRYGGVYIHAGPEIGVASTKAFTSQVMALNLIALYIRQVRGIPFKPWMKKYLRDLRAIPKQVARIVEQRQRVKRIARKYRRFRNFFFLGRGINYPVAMEGALKLKEISYIHAEGYPSGEMKHGPIALISRGFPSVFILPHADEKYDKIISNMQEVKSRGGRIIVIASEGDKRIAKYRVTLRNGKKVRLADDIIYVPRTSYYLTPLVVAPVLQLLAYYMAVELGRNVDQPRNLAKSVTVE